MVPRSSKSKPLRATPPPSRVRRTAEAARVAILDATERRLIAAGPAGIRLQEVAADVGVSHSTVLHHFGSRENLVKAVCERTFAAIHAEIVEAIGRSGGAEGQVAALLDGVSHALTTRGHGRVVVWLALAGTPIGGGEVQLTDVVSATHALRKARRAGAAKLPPLEDTAHTVVLAALALLAESVVGPAIFGDAGLGPDAGARFRAWLARLLVAHLDR